MSNRGRRARIEGVMTGAVLVLGLAICFPAQAQIEEVIVTATKREENVQDVPIAITVLNEEAINSVHGAGFEALQQLVPSVSFRKGTTNSNSAVVIRGIGTISFSSAGEPSVSTVVDGVVLSRSGQAFTDLYDVERMEVLRGPQGTLFGKNASAGVVNITTKRPTDEFDAYVDFSAFQDDEVRVKARASGPLSDNANGSLTVFSGDFDGNIRNVFTNENINGYDRQGVRAMLDYTPADNLSVLFIAESYSAKDDCCADLEGLPSGRHPNSEALPHSSGIVNGRADIDLNQRRVDHDLTTVTLDDTTAFSAQLDFDFGGGYTLTSISAYRKWENIEIREGDFTSIGGSEAVPVFAAPFKLHDIGEEEWRQLSEELRIVSPSGADFEWLAGLFVWNIRSDRNFTRDASCQNNGGQNAAILAANPGLTCNANDLVSATAYFDSEFSNLAIFGEGRYHLSDDWTLVFGGRFTDDEVTFNHNRRSNDQFGRQGLGVRPAAPNGQFPPASGGFNSNFAGVTDDTNFSGKVTLQWKHSDSGLLYATAAQGYKGPAFNTFYNMGLADVLPINSEESDAFEIGYKFSSSTFLANLALFSTDISDFQANNFDTSTGVTITRLTNAGDVSTEGLELDFLWAPGDQFSLSGGATFLTAEIDRFNCPIEPTTGLPPPNCSARSGLEVPFAPDLKYSLSAHYRIPVGEMEVLLNGTFVHVDEQQSTLPENNGTFAPEALLPAYDIFNASVGFSLNDDALRVTLIGNNLFDEAYVTTYSGDGFRYQYPRDVDRYFGVNVRASF